MSDIRVAQIIAGDPAGPFPDAGQHIRCYLTDGQVIDGVVQRVWLDLDTVRIDVAVPPLGRLTPARGDKWEAR
jgi:hypothetical protein